MSIARSHSLKRVRLPRLVPFLAPSIALGPRIPTIVICCAATVGFIAGIVAAPGPDLRLAGIFLAILAGSFVAGFAGFAFSAVAGAILLHFTDAAEAVPLLLICSVTTQLFSVIRFRHSMRWRETWLLLTGGVVGIPAGAAVLTAVDPKTFAIGFGVFLLCYAGYMLAKPSVCIGRGGRWTEVVVGFVGGVTGGAIAFPGAIPTIWCSLRKLGKAEQRSLVQPFILAMQIMTLMYFSAAGLLSLSLLGLYLWCAPVVLVGTWLGFRCFDLLDEASFRKLVLALIIFSAAGLLW